MRNHTCMDLFWSLGQLDASIAWEVPCTGTGTLDCAFCRGLSDPSRTSDGYALVPGIGASLRASARRSVTLKKIEDGRKIAVAWPFQCYMEASCPTPPRHSALHFVAQNCAMVWPPYRWCGRFAWKPAMVQDVGISRS
jgi:hypothetical protein